MGATVIYCRSLLIDAALITQQGVGAFGATADSLGLQAEITDFGWTFSTLEAAVRILMARLTSEGSTTTVRASAEPFHRAAGRQPIVGCAAVTLNERGHSWSALCFACRLLIQHSGPTVFLTTLTALFPYGDPNVGPSPLLTLAALQVFSGVVPAFVTVPLTAGVESSVVALGSPTVLTALFTHQWLPQWESLACPKDAETFEYAALLLGLLQRYLTLHPLLQERAASDASPMALGGGSRDFRRVLNVVLDWREADDDVLNPLRQECWALITEVARCGQAWLTLLDPTLSGSISQHHPMDLSTAPSIMTPSVEVPAPCAIPSNATLLDFLLCNALVWLTSVNDPQRFPPWWESTAVVAGKKNMPYLDRQGEAGKGRGGLYSLLSKPPLSIDCFFLLFFGVATIRYYF